MLFKEGKNNKVSANTLITLFKWCINTI